MSTIPLRTAIVGCGAIAELGHLPAAVLCQDLEITLLVDSNRERAEALAKQFEIKAVSTEVSDVFKHADAAIVAVPHHLHASIANELLAGGIHVLIEKPMAMSTAECDTMIHTAEANSAILAIAMPRRFCESTRFIQQALQSEILGKIRSFSIESGTAESWPSRSLYLLRPEQSGGGVLMSSGCHDLDLVLALFGEPTEIQCAIDSRLKSEANCILDLNKASGVTGRIELSVTRNLKNRIRIEGELGIIEAPLLGASATLTLTGGEPTVGLTGVISNRENAFLDAMKNQLVDFVRAVQEGVSAKVPAEEGRRVLKCIEECYAAASPMIHPWSQPIFVAAS